MQHLIGKRVNVGGSIGSVLRIVTEDIAGRPGPPIAIIDFDGYVVHGSTLASVVERLPEVISRASFVYRPGDSS